ncbi:class I SAM-dependent methyltransferase [Nocardia sp. CDC159]|uniref:Class I SAM-dependent methyltransferase n=1 Tax=Nocardia pulmonis TaxID=2951408 RepID=A0A9X2ECI4_9NOCA|nr:MULTISPECIES: class I SAM-dependent methyltransferase [Nocardia]MCM6778319.1 class I SAM-dependent methyltransferase [Nocardia pulmonis]MCM6791285.1 class I SAM-dependent methyltransferase [Nocardia sp. CDC159]
MKTSLIYRNGRIYELLMRGLYGSHYGARFRAIAELIPEGASVVDVCCGPATLYTRHLRARAVDYTGLDLNAGFITRLIAAGGHGQVWNVRADAALPPADFVVMQASLYHFLPDAAPVVDRMLAAARERVILAEPVRNLATSDNPVLAAIGRRYTDAGDGAQTRRFTEATLDELFRAYENRVVARSLIAGGREKLYVLDARG